MEPERRIPIAHESDIVAARRQCREVAAPLRFSPADLAVIATAVSEIARNIVVYARHGEIRVREVERDGRRAVEIVAEDGGPGIPDLDRAMTDGWSTSRGLGLGLPGARRLMDEFAVRTAPGEGTCITMVKWCR